MTATADPKAETYLSPEDQGVLDAAKAWRPSWRKELTEAETALAFAVDARNQAIATAKEKEAGRLARLLVEKSDKKATEHAFPVPKRRLSQSK